MAETCRRGHPRTPENTYVRPNGDRECRDCWHVRRPLAVRPAPYDRVMARVQPQDECLIWTGHVNNNGYGTVSVDNRARYVHRITYEHQRGPIPDGLVIDHLCRTPMCVNPDHMEAVTPAENTLRGLSPWAIYARSVTCVNGHPWDAENTYIRPDKGSRQCRTCGNERRRRAYWAAKQSEAVA